MTSARDGLSRGSLVGSRIGRYDMVAEIGTGGMASVYLARSIGSAGFQRLVAIKVMHRHLSSDEAFVEMFLDEARVASTIHHPNVVAIMDVGLEDDLIFLIMEYVEGDSFSNVERVAVNLRRRIPLKIILRVTLDALAGLHNAHELTSHDDQPLKIIHRDVSPQNIMVGVDGNARIVDFGIAKAESRITTTKVGMIKGKLNFMAPEQLRGAALDRRVDIFGMGVTIWEAVTLRRLYSGDSDVDTARKIMTGEYPRLLDVDPKLPGALDDVVRRALAVSPDDRYATAAEFADAIESTLGAEIASHREVAAFMSGVAAQKIERERRAVREASAGGASGQVSTALAAQVAAEPEVSLDEDEPEVGGATVVETPAARVAALRAAVPRAATPPAGVPRAAPRKPTLPAVRAAMPVEPPAIVAGQHEVYDDDGDTALITRGNAAGAAAIMPFMPRSAVQGSPPDPSRRDSPPGARPGFKAVPARKGAVPTPRAVPIPSRGGTPSAQAISPPSVPSWTDPVDGDPDGERTMAIDLVRRSDRPGPPDPAEPAGAAPGGVPGIAPGAPSGASAGASAMSGRISNPSPSLAVTDYGPSPDLAPPALYGLAPAQPVVPSTAAPSGRGRGGLLLYVFLGIAMVSTASAVLWYVTHS